jgi:hypothetical protein
MGKCNYNRTLLRFSFLKVMLLTFLLAPLVQTELKAQAREIGENYNPPKKKKGFEFDSDRLRFGGGFGATFGDITYVELAPSVGYMVTDNYLAGISARYIYFERNDNFIIYKTNMYGGGVFNQYFFLENFLAHAEIEVLNRDDHRNFQLRQDKRVNVTSILVGGGYRSMIGDRSFASILLLYNINDDINSPYTNPILRINFGFGI